MKYKYFYHIGIPQENSRGIEILIQNIETLAIAKYCLARISKSKKYLGESISEIDLKYMQIYYSYNKLTGETDERVSSISCDHKSPNSNYKLPRKMKKNSAFRIFNEIYEYIEKNNELPHKKIKKLFRLIKVNNIYNETFFSGKKYNNELSYNFVEDYNREEIEKEIKEKYTKEDLLDYIAGRFFYMSDRYNHCYRIRDLRTHINVYKLL